MPDITPDSPVAALWPNGEGGLTGARARKRLETAGIATVGELRTMFADDILSIPRSGKGVLTEVRRALAANGLALALEPPPTPAQQQQAREAGQAEAERARKRQRADREDDPPVSAADFAALVTELRKELAEADAEQRRRMLAVPRLETPAAFRGRQWAWASVGPAGAAKVTGYAPPSIRAYKATAERERAAGTDTERTMPAPKDGKWVIGDLAVWIATRNEEQAAGYAAGPRDHREARRERDLIPATRAAAETLRDRDGQVTFLGLARELGTDYRTAVGRAAMAGIESDLAQERAGDDDVAAFLSARLAETRRHLTFGRLMETLHEAGMPAMGTQVKRLLPDLRAADRMRKHKPSGDLGRARGESLHPDGWLYAGQVAEDWGVTSGAITGAIRRGDIRVAERSQGRAWIDRKRLRARTDAIRTPVDVSSPKARLEPGDPGYQEERA